MDVNWESQLRLRAPEVSIQTRYEHVITYLVPRFLDRNHMTYSGLAELVGVERTTLSRFINRQKGHIPTATRPKRLALLEKLERVCSQENLIVDRSQLGRVIPEGPDGDFEIWFRNFTARLQNLRTHTASQGLALVPELFAQAITAPAPWGASMCNNLILIMMGHLFKADISDASPQLLHYTEYRITRLLDRVTEVATEEFRSTEICAPRGYAGAAWLRIGTLLNDDSIIERGLEYCLSAVTTEHRKTGRHWSNLLLALEDIFCRNHPRAGEWSTRVAQTAAPMPPDNLLHTHKTFDLPNIRNHWARVSPQLYVTIERLRHAHDEQSHGE